MKFLLQQHQKNNPAGLHSSVRARSRPVWCNNHGICSSRVARLFVDAAANTSSPVRVEYPEGGPCFDGAVLELARRSLLVTRTSSENPPLKCS